MRDIGVVIDATKDDYFGCLESELHRATQVWIEDSIQLLPKSTLAVE